MAFSATWFLLELARSARFTLWQRLGGRSSGQLRRGRRAGHEGVFPVCLGRSAVRDEKAAVALI